MNKRGLILQTANLSRRTVSVFYQTAYLLRRTVGVFSEPCGSIILYVYESQIYSFDFLHIICIYFTINIPVNLLTNCKLSICFLSPIPDSLNNLIGFFFVMYAAYVREPYAVGLEIRENVVQFFYVNI